MKVKPGSHLRDKHNTSEISVSISTRKRETCSFFLVLMLMLMSIVLCLSHKSEPRLSVRSLYILCKLANQCSYPEFLAASCRCGIKVKLACSLVLGSRNSSSFAKLKSHEHVAKAATCLTLAVVLVFLAPLAQYNGKV